jgi:NitT/TauT family transport system ATP-binding protein
VEDVSKGFKLRTGRISVLRSVTFAAEPGEVVGIVGANGTGKSTLFRILAGLVPPDAGVAAFDRQPVQNIAVSLAPQRYRESLFPWRTVHSNLRLPFESDTVPHNVDENAIIEDVMAKLGIADLRNARPYRLSGGQAQLVALARALAMTWPPLLLLDEPFSALDGSNLARAASAVYEAVRRRAIVLLVTHDIDVSLLMSNRIVVLGHGAQSVQAIVPSPCSGKFTGVFDMALLKTQEYFDVKARVLDALFHHPTEARG